jgi:heterodisulfide reductase subunit C
VLRLLQLGLREQAARHPFLYACKYCGKCLVNCPQGLAVARILKRLAFERVILC